MKQHNNQFMSTIAHLSKSRSATLGAIVIILLIGIAIFAPQLSPNNPTQRILQDRLTSPCIEYPFGTDELGRCVLSRILYGARISLGIGFIVVIISGLVGIILGIVSGYYGGLADSVIMRLVDATMAFPSIFLALVIAGILGKGLVSVAIALIVIDWTKYARVSRGSVLSIKEKEFVESARSLGAYDHYIMLRHIFPNIIAPIIVIGTLGIAYAILSVGTLGFLGFGPQPSTPEWGTMLYYGCKYMRTAPYLMIFPGLAIMITVLAFNLFGDGLRDIIDPKQEIIE